MMHKNYLKKKTGCLRCKQRHKQCDERRPSCSFCIRWELSCCYPDRPEQQSRDVLEFTSVAPIVSERPKAVARKPQRCLLSKPIGIVPCIDPFHHFPLSNTTRQPLGPSLLRDFLTSAANTNVSSDGVKSQSAVISGWLESSILDEAASCALITYWAKCSVNRTPRADIKTLSLEFEGRTLQMLQRRIESGASVTEETVLAAAVHFIAAALDLTNRLETRKMLMGINALIVAVGGIGKVMSTMKASTVLSVLICDIFNSNLNADPHFFANTIKPELPDSFGPIYTTKIQGLDLSQHIHEDVVCVLDDIDFLLSFRHPSRQTRSLSATEAQYIAGLGEWIDFQLGVLQYRHIGTRSISEIVIIALIIVKQEVVAEGAEHPILIVTLLKRLREAILFCQAKETPAYQTLSMWASLVSLVGSTVRSERVFFLTFIQSTLRGRYGEEMISWPQTWETDVGMELQQVLWHTRIASQYYRTCLELGHDTLVRVSEP